MSIERARKDVNRVNTLIAVSNDSNLEPRLLVVDPATDRLLVSAVSTGSSSEGTTGTIAPTSATEIGIVYNVTPPAPTNGQMIAGQSDSQGDLKVYLASLLAGEVLAGSVINDAIVNAIHTGALIGAGVYNTSPTTLTNGQTGAFQLDATNRLLTSTKQTTPTAVVTSVASSASTVSLLASNTSRTGAVFFNDSTQVLYLKFGTTASTTSYTVQIAAGGYFEVPLPVYTGAIDGIWASANGNVRITETT